MGAAIASFLAPFLPKLLDWIVGSLTKFGRSIWVRSGERSKVRKEKKESDAQLRRLKKALTAGYDNKPLTKEQKKEIDEAFTDLSSGY